MVAFSRFCQAVAVILFSLEVFDSCIFKGFLHIVNYLLRSGHSCGASSQFLNRHLSTGTMLKGRYVCVSLRGIDNLFRTRDLNGLHNSKGFN